MKNLDKIQIFPLKYSQTTINFDREETCSETWCDQIMPRTQQNTSTSGSWYTCYAQVF